MSILGDGIGIPLPTQTWHLQASYCQRTTVAKVTKKLWGISPNIYPVILSSVTISTASGKSDKITLSYLLLIYWSNGLCNNIG